MRKFIYYKDIEKAFEKFQESVDDLPFKEVLNYLVDKGKYSVSKDRRIKRSLLNEQEYIDAIYQTQISVDDYISDSRKIDSSLLPKQLDVFAIKHFYFQNQGLYSHNCINILFSYRGMSTLIFEGKEITLKEGNLCIIAPNSKYKIIQRDSETITIDIFVRKSTFDYTFSSSLAGLDIISEFFKQILYTENTQPNFLFFSNKNLDDIKEITRNILIESNYVEKYSNRLLIHYLNLLFILIVRYFDFEQTYYSFKNDKFEHHYHILLYVQEHYANISLKKLAKTFNYNQSYLSSLFKKTFNFTFNQYLTSIRLAKSKELLSRTNDSISDIAYAIGYSSPDHFTRTFKKNYSLLPSQFREIKNELEQ